MMRLKRVLIVRLWIGVVSAIAMAPLLRAQLDVNTAETRNTLMVFLAKEAKSQTNASNVLGVKFDLKIDFDAEGSLASQDDFTGGFPSASDSIVSFQKNSLVLPSFSEGLLESLNPSFQSRFELEDSPPIPEPSTYGLFGTLVLSALMLLHRIRDRSAALAV